MTRVTWVSVWAAVIAAGCVAALLATQVAVVVGLMTLAPVISHVRHVGWRHSISEPSAMTLIIVFYLLLFPLRGLVIVASGETDLSVPGLPITDGDVISLLALASACTTVLVEGYYLTRRWKPATLSVLTEPVATHRAVERSMYLLSAISVLSLMVVIARNGGPAGARNLYITHSTIIAASASTGSAGSAWVIFANPSIWLCAYVLFNVGSSRICRNYALGVSLLLVAADLYIYGSRLNVTLALVGVWIIYHYSGRRTRTGWVLAALLAGIFVSQLIIASRLTASNPYASQSRISTLENYSRTSAYGVLDVSLWVHQRPQQLRDQIDSGARYLRALEYLVPHVLWHGRPNIGKVAIGYYTSIDVNPVTGRDSGLPTTFITEPWLLFGWPGALLWSLCFGLVLGWLSWKLVGQETRASPFGVLGYCFVVAFAWNYFKDGDLLASAVGDFRTAIYLLFLVWLVGVIGVDRRRAASRAKGDQLPTTTAGHPGRLDSPPRQAA